jgi:excisionase family DNA binding protein
MMSKTNANIEELICIEDLCRILKLKKSYIYLLTHEKKIPHYKLNGHLRFRLSDIEDWIRKQFITTREDVKIVDF